MDGMIDVMIDFSNLNKKFEEVSNSIERGCRGSGVRYK